MPIVSIKQKVLIKNDTTANEIRDYFNQHGIRCINLIGSPGSGKTTLLESLIQRFGSDMHCAVVEGDVKTDHDMQRIAKTGIPAVQIETDGACHLNAGQVREAIQGLPLDKTNFLVIENVGNLICPVSYDLGEHNRIIVLSVAEGVDKPLKYPSAFMSADTLVISKIDLAQYVDVDPEDMKNNALSVNPGLNVFLTSAKTGAGMDTFKDFLAGFEI